MRAFLTHPFWIWVTMGAVVLGLVASVLFVVRYTLESGRDAWRNPFGRFLLTRKALLAALFALVLANSVWGEWLGRRPVVAILMVAFALQTFVPYRLLMDAQKAHDKEEARQDERVPE